MSQPNKPDALWYTRCSVPTPLSFAAQFGWINEEFAPDGIEIKSLRESNDASEKASHYDHTLPHSFRQGGSIPPIWTRANGQETRVIGISWTDEHQAIIASPQAGIRTVKELRGRRVGIPKHETRIDHNRASALRAFTVILEREGLSLNDVELVDLADAAYPARAGEPGGSGGRQRHTYANEVYALSCGEIDAVYVKDVRGLDVASILGANIVADLSFHLDPFVRISNCTPRPLTVNANTIEQYPELVERFLTRVIEAGEWAKTHPAETVTWIGRETGWAERSVRRSFGDQIHNHLTIDLSEQNVQGLDTLKNFLFANGFLANDFDTQQWVDTRPLEAVLSRGLRKAA